MTRAGPITRPIRWRRPGPRTVSAVALIVLGACAATIVVFPATPVSLRSLPNWYLAELLPTVHEFPESLNYSLRGAVQRVDPHRADAAPPNYPATYTPSECGKIPPIASLFRGSGYSAIARVNRHPDQIARGVVQTSNDDPDSYARFVIYPVIDGAAMITEYVDWLQHCGTHHVTAQDPNDGTAVSRVVVTTVDARTAPGADATLSVAKVTTTTAPDPVQTMTYHISYYWVRGVLLECASNFAGADAELANHLAAQTLRKLATR